MPGVLIKHDHEGGEIPDYHENVWLGDSVLLDRIGRKHRNGYTRWAVVICNNPKCKFKALVNAEVVTDQTL